MGSRRGSILQDLLVGVYNLNRTYSSASEVEIEYGIAYYPNFRERLRYSAAAVGCTDMRKIAGVFSALSPNNSEDSNVRDMVRAIKYYGEGRWDELKVHSYPLNKNKAFLILEGNDPEYVLGGPKTRNFYHNLLDPYDDKWVTVDGHMVNVYNGRRVKLDDAGISESGYALVSSAIREVAGNKGLRPNQMQSTLWVTWRRMHGIFYKPLEQMGLDFGE